MDFENRISKLAEAFESYVVEAAYGRAAMAAHYFESILVMRLAVHHVSENGPKIESLERKLGILKKKTLGGLICEVNKELALNEYWTDELDNLLYFRNYLIHNIAELVSGHLYNHGDKTKIVEELDEITGFFQEAITYFQAELYEWFGENGITKEAIFEASRKLVDRAKNQEN